MATQDNPALVRVLIWLIVLAALVWFLRQTSWVIGLVVVSLLIVYCLAPLVNCLVKARMPRGLAVLLVYLAFLALPVLIGYAVFPMVVTQLTDLARAVPDVIEAVEPWVVELGRHVNNPRLVDSLYAMMDDLPDLLRQTVSQLTRTLNALVSRVVETFIVLMTVFYLLRDLPTIKKEIENFLPQRWRQDFLHLMEVVDVKVGDYIRGNLVRCVVVGVLTGTGLWLLDMPFFLVLALFAGIMNVLPYIGPYVAGIPAVLLALAQPFPYPLLVVLLYVAVQLLDGTIITPIFLGRAVNLHPLTIILALVTGARLAGILGLLVATPVVAVLKVVIHYYRQRGVIPA